MDKETRIFFVVDSKETNEELYDTLEEAIKAKDDLNVIDKPRIRACLVRNAYKEDGLRWNYEDLSDTFTPIKTL